MIQFQTNWINDDTRFETLSFSSLDMHCVKLEDYIFSLIFKAFSTHVIINRFSIRWSSLISRGNLSKQCFRKRIRNKTRKIEYSSRYKLIRRSHHVWTKSDKLLVNIYEISSESNWILLSNELNMIKMKRKKQSMSSWKTVRICSLTEETSCDRLHDESCINFIDQNYRNLHIVTKIMILASTRLLQQLISMFNDSQ